MSKRPHHRPGQGRTRKADRSRDRASPKSTDRPHLIYGLHAVRAALANPARSVHRLHATPAARERLGADLSRVEIREIDTDRASRLAGRDAVHQGVVLDCAPLDRLDQTELFQLADERLVVVLDQVTDPHNVGAVMRSAVACGAGAICLTARNAAPETGVLAKSASGALDMIRVAELRSLAKGIETLREHGFTAIGLDSDGGADLADLLAGQTHDRIALVLGAEGRGLREGTRAACDHLARIDLPGPIRTLNVSNAAALSLYLAQRALG